MDSAIRVRRGGSGPSSWQFAEAEPAPDLATVVRGYTGFVETSRQPLRRREAPSNSSVAIINFGVPLEIAAPGRATAHQADSFVARLSDLPATTSFTGTSAGIQVDFTPLGLYLFCGQPIADLPDPVVGLTELLGSQGRILTERLADASGWGTRFAILDEAIRRRVVAARPPRASIEWAWRTLEQSGGRTGIGAIAQRLGCSHRHLLTGFREQVGVSPKVAARILRFDRAAALVRDAGAGQLALVAQTCGYHDQAHMTREFSGLAGVTPAAYRAAVLSDHVGVAA
jgi:AraC-like DNA-binding protein